MPHRGITKGELEDYFSPYGDIIDIRLNEKENKICPSAYIAYSKVEYAIQASQDMDNSIIDRSGSARSISVTLLNPDARVSGTFFPCFFWCALFAPQVATKTTRACSFLCTYFLTSCTEEM